MADWQRATRELACGAVAAGAAPLPTQCPEHGDECKAKYERNVLYRSGLGERWRCGLSEVAMSDRARATKIPAGQGYSHPERRVVRAGVSPMNPKVKWAELDCGHDVFRTRKPRIGATIVCPQCAGVGR